MAGVQLDGVSKVYADGTRAVDDLDLTVDDGEFVVLVGPSGCGKTTALRMVAGLEEISEGEVRIGDKVVNRVPPKDRDIAMVFQNYALYPHLTVGENMGFSLKLRKVSKDTIKERVHKAAQILGIEEFLDRKPRNLSGGQRQRVAMGRAIVREPAAFLMDEPLSNLDAKLRVQMRAEIARIQRDLATTTIYVTHDQTEAMTMADRVAVMKKGVLQQMAGPQELYDRPTNLFVGAFIGSPAMNLFEAGVEEADGDLWLTFGRQRLRVAESLVAERPALRSYSGRSVVLGIRPEEMEDAALAASADDGTRVDVDVTLVEQMGAEAYVHFDLEASPALTEDTKDLAADLGAEKAEALEAQASRSRTECVARLSPRTKAAKGDRIGLVVDTARLHFFDRDTGGSIWDGDNHTRTPTTTT